MAITTDEELQTEVGKLAVADPTNIPAVTGIVPTVGAGEDIASASGQLGAAKCQIRLLDLVKQW